MEIFFRLTMLLVGFLLVFLGFVVTLHSSHYVVSILLLFGGVMTMFGGIPDAE
jgi:uncharacterized membrane protein